MSEPSDRDRQGRQSETAVAERATPRFLVMGVDELGDSHVFMTDVLRRAQAMFVQLRRDLPEVELIDLRAAH